MLHRLRLISGLILFIYVFFHLMNISLGLISIAAQEAMAGLVVKVWRSPPGTLLLYGAILVHFGLALFGLYRRRQLSMPYWEAAQVILGLSIPPLLILHVLGTRIVQEFFHTNDSFTYVQTIYFVVDPVSGIRQVAVLLVAWIHACLGIHFWLRFKPGYRPWFWAAYSLALLVPVLALLGLWSGGQEILRQTRDPAWLDATLAELRFVNAQDYAFLLEVEKAFFYGFGTLIGLVFAGRLLRNIVARRHGRFDVTYSDGRRISASKGSTILEVSRSAGILHASVCGGRGRCSTCRVRIDDGIEHLPQPSEEEVRVLKRVSAPPRVRLACQTRPQRDVRVHPLLPALPQRREASRRPGYLSGDEREIAVLFADIRGFTTLSEKKLPFDVVFILNRYFQAMGEAVAQAGGHVDKFIGDGVMALFGIEDGVEAGARQSLQAATSMSKALGELNQALAGDLRSPLRIGIGIHSGPVILGEMGYGKATSVTAIGDTVNTASRLEGLTKDYGAELIFSEPLAQSAGFDISQLEQREIEVRGRNQPLTVVIARRARHLSLAQQAGGPLQQRDASPMEVSR